jgi:hypothetical protein
MGGVARFVARLPTLKFTTLRREASSAMTPKRISSHFVGNAIGRSIQDNKGDTPQLLIDGIDFGLGLILVNGCLSLLEARPQKQYQRLRPS